MLCLEVRINEDNPLIAGIDHAIMLTGHVAGFVGGDEPAAIHIAGMCELENQRDAHVYWSSETPLKAGDKISVRLIESDYPTPYLELKPTDSPEYLNEQREYFEAEASWIMEAANRARPTQLAQPASGPCGRG